MIRNDFLSMIITMRNPIQIQNQISSQPSVIYNQNTKSICFLFLTPYKVNLKENLCQNKCQSNFNHYNQGLPNTSFYGPLKLLHLQSISKINLMNKDQASLMFMQFKLGESLEIAKELQCCYRSNKEVLHEQINLKSKKKPLLQKQLTFNHFKKGDKIYYRYLRQLNDVIEVENGDRIFSLQSELQLVTDQWNTQVLQIILNIPIPHGDYSLCLTEKGVKERECLVLLQFDSRNLFFQGFHDLQLGTEKIILQFQHTLGENLRNEVAIFEINVDQLDCYSNRLILDLNDKISKLNELFLSQNPLEFAEQNQDSLNDIYPNLIFQKVRIEFINLQQQMKDHIHRLEEIIPQIKQSQALMLKKPDLRDLNASVSGSIKQEFMEQSIKASQISLKQSIAINQSIKKVDKQNQNKDVKLPAINKKMTVSQIKQSQLLRNNQQRFETEIKDNDYYDTVEAFQHKIMEQRLIINKHEEMLDNLRDQISALENKLGMNEFLITSLKNDMNLIIQNVQQCQGLLLEKQLMRQIITIEEVFKEHKLQKKELIEIGILVKDSIKTLKKDQNLKQSAIQYQEILRQSKLQQQQIYNNLDCIVQEIQEDKQRIKHLLQIQNVMQLSSKQDSLSSVKFDSKKQDPQQDEAQQNINLQKNPYVVEKQISKRNLQLTPQIVLERVPTLKNLQQDSQTVRQRSPSNKNLVQTPQIFQEEIPSDKIQQFRLPSNNNQQQNQQNIHQQQPPQQISQFQSPRNIIRKTVTKEFQ